MSMYIRSIVFHVLTYTVQDYTVHDTVYCTVFSWVSTSKAIRWYVYWNRIRAHRFSSGKGLAELATARCSSDQADLTMTKNKILQALARCSKTWSISYWNCALCTGGGGGGIPGGSEVTMQLNPRRSPSRLRGGRVYCHYCVHLLYTNRDHYEYTLRTQSYHWSSILLSIMGLVY